MDIWLVTTRTYGLVRVENEIITRTCYAYRWMLDKPYKEITDFLQRRKQFVFTEPLDPGDIIDVESTYIQGADPTQDGESVL